MHISVCSPVSCHNSHVARPIFSRSMSTQNLIWLVTIQLTTLTNVSHAFHSETWRTWKTRSLFKQSQPLNTWPPDPQADVLIITLMLLLGHKVLNSKCYTCNVLWVFKDKMVMYSQPTEHYQSCSYVSSRGVFEGWALKIGCHSCHHIVYRLGLLFHLW